MIFSFLLPLGMGTNIRSPSAHVRVTARGRTLPSRRYRAGQLSRARDDVDGGDDVGASGVPARRQERHDDAHRGEHE
jgi:hypothetical protein